MRPLVKCVYSEKGAAHSLINTPWTPQRKLLCMQGLWDWLYDNQDVQPLNVPVTQIRVNAVIKGAAFAHVTLLLQS